MVSQNHEQGRVLFYIACFLFAIFILAAFILNIESWDNGIKSQYYNLTKTFQDGVYIVLASAITLIVALIFFIIGAILIIRRDVDVEEEKENIIEGRKNLATSGIILLIISGILTLASFILNIFVLSSFSTFTNRDIKANDAYNLALYSLIIIGIAILDLAMGIYGAFVIQKESKRV